MPSMLAAMGHVRAAVVHAPGRFAVESFPQPDPELDVVVSQETQHRIHRAQPFEQVQDQADHGLGLLIGIQGHLT